MLEFWGLQTRWWHVRGNSHSPPSDNCWCTIIYKLKKPAGQLTGCVVLTMCNRTCSFSTSDGWMTNVTIKHTIKHVKFQTKVNLLSCSVSIVGLLPVWWRSPHGSGTLGQSWCIWTHGPSTTSFFVPPEKGRRNTMKIWNKPSMILLNPTSDCKQKHATLASVPDTVPLTLPPSWPAPMQLWLTVLSVLRG